MLLLPLLLFSFLPDDARYGRQFTLSKSNRRLFLLVNFSEIPLHYLWVKKITSSMVTDQLDCTFLCVGEPKCYSFNMAAYPDSKGLYLCELLATDKYRATNKFHANATFHHYSPSVIKICSLGQVFCWFINTDDARYGRQFTLSKSNRRLSVGEFQRNPFHYLWVKKITSSMVTDQLDCTFLCVGEPKCYSFNMAAYPDSKGLYLCELLATDKYRAINKFHANATFHHYSPSVILKDL
ncbi:hypothetical protein OS493_038693 [Desmophyllum pertusum]|uniref:Apple domain-containing protein n=1 Tax=Desmophyllum pertusum TaxID=174260 RepID=A0A9W9Y6W6_9CNID|nr:hypothetical protein OS493_038693 [Desmophyllum pertusum]